MGDGFQDKPTVTIGDPTKKSDYDNLVDFVSGGDVQDGDAGKTLVVADFGKSIRVASGSAQIVTLPSVSASNIGGWYEIFSNGAGKVTIQCVDSDTISTWWADSAATGKAENDANDKFLVKVKLISATEWYLQVDGDGWIIT